MTALSPRRLAARARRSALMVAALAGALTACTEPSANHQANAVAAERRDKPRLMLLTSLPLMFGDSFGLEQSESPALTALERRYAIVPISTTDAAELGRGDLLLMAHPLAQTAEALVDLDSWVRGGGRLLLLADPALDWHSDRPLGDNLRPPPGFADTGLLAHWGLRLDTPDERGPRLRRLGQFEILAASPGSLSGACQIKADGFVADCTIGDGRAVIVADADFLNVDDLDGPTDRNLDALLAELEGLERR